MFILPTEKSKFSQKYLRKDSFVWTIARSKYFLWGKFGVCDKKTSSKKKSFFNQFVTTSWEAKKHS